MIRPDEVDDAFGKRARATYATGPGSHAEGEVMGYSIVPMICIETDDGQKIWWRHDLVELIQEEK